MLSISSLDTNDGFIIVRNGKDHMYLDKIGSYDKGRGIGTKLFREVFKRSLEAGYEGRVELQAASSSHIFHLKMGFLPKEREVLQAPKKYGPHGRSALDQIKSLFPYIKKALDKNNELSHHEREVAAELKKILEKEKIGVYPDAAKITDEQLLAEEEFLLQLRTINGSYIQLAFVPSLISAIEKTEKEDLPNTENFGHVDMYLSQDGIERWKEDCDGKVPFQPFRKFEHLHEWMTPQQREKIMEILNQ